MAAPGRVIVLRVLTIIVSATPLGACERVTSSSGARDDTVVVITQIGDSLQLRARSLTRGDSLVTAVEVRNAIGRPLRLEWGACAVRLRLFHADRGAHAVYDFFLQPEPPGTERVCFAYLTKKTIAPGEMIAAREFTWDYPLQCILGDSLAPGVYHSVLTVTFSRPGGMFGKVDVEAEAGHLELRPSRAKLPSNERCS
jgi:hypothetical protein